MSKKKGIKRMREEPIEKVEEIGTEKILWSPKRNVTITFYAKLFPTSQT